MVGIGAFFADDAECDGVAREEFEVEVGLSSSIDSYLTMCEVGLYFGTAFVGVVF